MALSLCTDYGSGMERVGLVVLSITMATVLLWMASYGALWLQPYLENIHLPWPVLGLTAVFPMIVALVRRRAQK